MKKKRTLCLNAERRSGNVMPLRSEFEQTIKVGLLHVRQEYQS